jgi:hypothetical protein
MILEISLFRDAEIFECTSMRYSQRGIRLTSYSAINVNVDIILQIMVIHSPMDSFIPSLLLSDNFTVDFDYAQ